MILFLALVDVVEASWRQEELHRLVQTELEEEYELDAPWNTRLTPTGEFIHTATWAYGRLGRYNGSHGCTNMFERVTMNHNNGWI